MLIIVENLPVPFDRRVWNEARSLQQAGYQVSVICPAMPPHPQRRETIDGIDIHRHRLPIEAHGALGYLLEYTAALLAQSWLAWRVFFGRGFDAIHACNPPDTIFLVAAMFRPFGRRLLFDHHDLNPELYEAKFGRRDALWRMLCRLEGWTFRAAQVSIATNESYRRIAIARGGMPPDRVFVVRSGPDLARLPDAVPDPGLREGFRHLVAYVGTMGQQEGIPLLLEAARQLRDRHGRQDVLFRLIGGGPEVDRLRAMATAMGLAAMIRFDGRQPDARLFATLATATLCVNPDSDNALNQASTMNKIIEYMAAGKPIVQFDLTEGRVSAGDASLYARPDDPADMADLIQSLLDDPDGCAAMGAHGRARVEQRLAWHHQVPTLLAAYEKLFQP